MTTYSNNDFKAGLKIMIDGSPCVILEHEFVKPGKGQAFTRVKYNNLHSGKTLEKTFRSTESTEAADIVEIAADFLYADDDQWHFMSPDDFEQYAISADVLGSSRQWLVPQTPCQLTLHKGAVLSVALPNFVELEVTATDPGVKGDTAAGSSSKPATLEGGSQLEVPLFVSVGDKIKVDTRTGGYVARIKS